MNFADSFLDRHMSSTYNNDYANGLNDENEWSEDASDYEVSADTELDDFLMTSDTARDLYNENGYHPGRIN